MLHGGRIIKVRITRYWDFDFRSAKMTLEDAVDETRRLFVQAVHRQLVSDVPVASYISGGLDTGSIVAVACHEVPGMRTFTCGFDMTSVSGLELMFDERKQARETAKIVKSDHREVVLHAGHMESVMPELVRCLEDLRVGQCYPNYYVAELAAKHNKVVLSGTGGDEIFGGYPWRYAVAQRNNSREVFLREYYRYWRRLVPEGDNVFAPDITERVKSYSTYDLFKSLVSDTGEQANDALYFEAKTFLHGLLVVEDRVSMAHALETRVPFLDNDLVDFAMRIPPQYKVDGNVGKVVLREALRGIAPEGVLKRPKQGFSAPDGTWYRGQSIEYVKNVLRSDKVALYDFLDKEYVTRRLDDHFSGRSNQRLFIWSLLCFELWLKEFMS